MALEGPNQTVTHIFIKSGFVRWRLNINMQIMFTAKIVKFGKGRIHLFVWICGKKLIS